METSGVEKLSTDEEPANYGGGGGSRQLPYGLEGASRSFTPKARRVEETPTVSREKKIGFERLLRMLERRDSSYTMEAASGNRFKMTDISEGDWIEIAAPVLGEHLLFLVKDSHQLRQRVAVRDEQLRIQTERVLEPNHKLKTQSNEISVAHAHEDVAIKAAQAARETLAGTIYVVLPIT